MGFLIPENIPSRNGVPEPLQDVARCLRDMVDDSITVWLHENDGGAAEALLVLDPSAGLMLIEAPSQTKLGLRKRLGFLKRSSTAPRLDVIRADVAGRTELVERLLGAEERLGAEFPTAAVLALPTLGAREFRRLSLEGQPTDYLLREDFSEDKLRPAIARVLRAPAGQPLTEAEERLVRGTLKPEIVISDLPNGGGEGRLVFQRPECDGDDVIRVLDREQERLAHHLGAGYRVIRGVAGSGKTLVLVYRARYLAESFPGHRFLLTCFNVALSRALMHQVGALPNIAVRTIDAIARQLGGGMTLRTNDDFIKQRERAVVVARESGDTAKYDAVFVDEAQDLDQPALDLAHALLRERREDFVVALDGAQNVYRKTARWNPPGRTARGRTTFLRTCYRNTREIVEFAWRFLQEANIAVVSDDKLDDPTLVIRPEATSRRGSSPVILQCASTGAEVDAIVRRIRTAGAAGVPWGQIAVLYGTQKRIVFPLLKRLREERVPEFWVTDPQDRKKRQQVVEAGDVVRVATMQGLKGLEFSRVFMCGVNDIYDPGADDETHRRKIAYVAVTRAMDELVVTVSGSGPIGRAIQAAAR